MKNLILNSIFICLWKQHFKKNKTKQNNNNNNNNRKVLYFYRL